MKVVLVNENDGKNIALMDGLPSVGECVVRTHKFYYGKYLGSTPERVTSNYIVKSRKWVIEDNDIYGEPLTTTAYCFCQKE